MIFLEVIAWVFAAGAAVPILILAVECLAGILGKCFGVGSPEDLGPRPRAVVLVPAHNEEALVAETVATLKGQIAPGDRILVVAHNCSDGTAALARSAGAEVLEAADEGTGGKPDALKHGLAYLDDDPPEVVVIIDADCHPHPGSIERLACAAARHAGPVQAVYLFAPSGDRPSSSISSLALLIKNHVRPLGLSTLGLPCLLNGAGSAYPFGMLRHAPHGQGSIAEDYQLCVDLLLKGHRTRFVPDADVRSTLPGREGTALKQRKRWEHGHIALVLGVAPRLILRGLVSLRFALVSLGLDLLVPPLALLVLLWSVGVALGILGWVWGASPWPLATGLFSGCVLALAILSAWLVYAGPRTTLRALARVPGYVLWKVPLYLAYLGKRETRWKKTERDHE